MNSLPTDYLLGDPYKRRLVLVAVGAVVANVDLREEEVEKWVERADVDFSPAANVASAEAVDHEVFDVFAGEDGGFDPSAGEAEFGEEGY